MMEVLLAACCAGASLAWREDYFDSSLRIVTDGDTAYVAAIASGVLVVDVRDPASPVLLGVCQMHGLTIDLHLSGSLLYVAAYAQGVVICDVRDPSSPVVRGSLCPADRCSCESVAVQGTTLYMGDWESHAVHIVDVADPASPLLLGTYDVDGDVHHVKVSGRHLYVAHPHGMDVVDVADPAAPALLGSYTGVSVWFLLLSGNLVYLGLHDPDGNVHAVDVSDPASITLVGSVEVGHGPFSSALRGTTLYVACEDGGVYIVDVSSAASPSVLGTFGDHAYGVATTETVVLATGIDAALRTIDTTTPSAPTLVGTYGAYGYAASVHTTDGVAVVGDGRREIRVFNISNPLAPVRLSTFGLDSAVVKLFVAEHLVYVGMANNFTVLSIADPSAPFLVGSKRTYDYYVKDVWAEGSTAYIVGHSGLDVYDMSDPSTPTWVGSERSVKGKGLVVVGAHAYVAAATSGLVVIDVSDRADPVVVGSAVVPGEAYGVSVVGEVAYVAARSGGMQVLNVSNVMELEIIGNYTLEDALHVQAVGDAAYVWGRSPEYVVAGTGLRFFDVTNPMAPALVDTAATDGDVRDIHAVGTAVYVADHGLRVFDASPEVGVPAPIEVLTPVGDDDSTGVPSWVWVVVSLGVVGVFAGVVAAYFATRKKSVPQNDSAPDTA